MSQEHQFSPTYSRAMLAQSPDILGPILKAGTDPSVISFGGGLPCPEGFPVEAIRDAANQVLDNTPVRALQYSDPQGEIELREAVARYETDRGTPTAANEVLIVSGSQQALDLIGRALCDPGSRVLVQRPTYIGALEAFSLSTPSYVEIPSDDEGVLPEKIGEEARGARFAYILPAFLNPTGQTLCEDRRRALVAKSREYDFWIVEDDPYGELWYRELPPRSIRSLAPERTIRLGSFSKILAPGLRLGYVIAPPPVIEKLTLMQSYSVLSTTCFSQLLAARVMNSGILKEHLPRVRALYRERAEAMLEGLEELMPKHPEIRWTHPKGGMFIWLTLPRAINTFKMMPKSLEKKVLYLPGDTFYAKNPEHNTIRLAFATMDRDKIREGLKRLAALVRQELAALQQPSGD